MARHVPTFHYHFVSNLLRIIDLRLQESGIDFKPEGVVLFLVECDLGFDLIPERLNLVEVR